MPYKYLEHEADIGILAMGDTLEEAFQEGAKAMFGVMVELDTVETLQEINISCEADDIPSLYVEWLNKLVSEKDIKDMFFKEFKVSIKYKNKKYYLRAKAYGETIDQDKHDIKEEVKAATYYGLKYEEKSGKHILQCVVDV
ncbi:archease [Candidatus Woesearchaeota archaeon]|nr:MAG: archease [Candidatus Woesearchaeota archaeon]